MFFKRRFAPFFLSCFTLLAALGSTAQTVTHTVTGRIVDSLSGKGIEYATIAVTDDSSRVVTAAAADAAGRFTLTVKRDGTFLLTAQSLGYTPVTRNITLPADKTKIDAGVFRLVQGVAIDEVTVAVQKPLIKSDADKITYSVEADPEATTSTLADILRKVPQISVDAENNVRLNGQTNFKVLVNGKNSPMFSNNLSDVISSMPAGTIKDIQVITNPSTKYEAEGAAGIINIITTKKTTNGFSGSVGAGISSFNSYSGNAFISAQIGKLNFSARYMAGRHGTPETTNRIETDYFLPEPGRSLVAGNGEGYRFMQNLGIEASYEIDTLNLLTLSVSGFDGKHRNNSFSDTRYWDGNGDIIRQYTNDNRSKNGFSSISASLDYQHTFRKPEHTLTISYLLNTNPNRTDYTNDIEGIVDYQTYQESSRDRASLNEHTVQVDYYNPITEKHQIETGVKYIVRLNDNNSDILRMYDEATGWQPYDDGNNNLDYTQHIFGLYGGYLFKLKKFSAKAGFRLEGTINDGMAKTSDGPLKFDNRQFDVIPYVNLSYAIKPSQSLRVSYTQRLQRPDIRQLNPYVNESDPMNIRYGNPNLEAVISHSFSANYSIFNTSWNLFLGVNGSFSNNTISEIKEVLDEGVTATTYENIGRRQMYGINGSYSYRLQTRLNVFVNANLNYSVIESKSRDLSNEGFNWGGFLGIGVGLWKDANFRANAGMFSMPVSLQGRNSSFYFTGVSLIQKLFKKKLDVTLSMQEPFNKFRKFDNRTEDSSIRQYSEFRMQSRRLSFGVNYRFGKLNTRVKKTSRGIKNDDRIDTGSQQEQAASSSGGM